MFKKAFLAAVPALLASHSALSADSFSCPASNVTWHSADATCSTITTMMADNDVKTFPAQKNGQATIKCSLGKLFVVNASCKSDSSNLAIDPLRVTDLPAAPFVPLPVLAGAGNLQNIHAANDQYSQKVTVIDPDGVSVNEISTMNPAPIQVSPTPVQTHWWDAYVGKTVGVRSTYGGLGSTQYDYTLTLDDSSGNATWHGQYIYGASYGQFTQHVQLIDGGSLYLDSMGAAGPTPTQLNGGCGGTPTSPFVRGCTVSNGGSGLLLTPVTGVGIYDPSCG